MADIPGNIIEAIRDPRWWGQWFPRPDEWVAWHAFLAALFALPMTEAQLAVYRQCTGRTEPPTVPAREVWAPTGRRGGKTRIAATVAAYLAVFVDWRQHLAPGERATIMLLAADRKQARVAMRYLRSLFVDHPGLRQLIENETQEFLELKNRVQVEVATASYKTTRGYSVAAVIADEIAFWSTDEASANPAAEIIAALRPALATMKKGALLMAVSSPYSRRGPLWDNYRRHWGKDGDPILVWKADTRTMNPTVAQEIIDEAMERDAASATAEYLAEFRSDLEAFISREAIEGCISVGVLDRAPIPGLAYGAFIDPSGGAHDSMTLAIAHRSGDLAVLDAIREVKPPFSPDGVVASFAELLRSYGIARVLGDHYGGQWPAERFRAHGIEYMAAARPKSAIYGSFLPAANSRRLDLLDSPRLVSQLTALERRTGRAADIIDHPPNAHDDLANAVAGALVAVLDGARVVTCAPLIISQPRADMFGIGVGGGSGLVLSDTDAASAAVNGIAPDGGAALMPYERWGA